MCSLCVLVDAESKRKVQFLLLLVPLVAGLFPPGQPDCSGDRRGALRAGAATVGRGLSQGKRIQSDREGSEEEGGRGGEVLYFLHAAVFLFFLDLVIRSDRLKAFCLWNFYFHP